MFRYDAAANPLCNRDDLSVQIWCPRFIFPACLVRICRIRDKLPLKSCVSEFGLVPERSLTETSLRSSTSVHPSSLDTRCRQGLHLVLAPRLFQPMKSFFYGSVSKTYKGHGFSEYNPHLVSLFQSLNHCSSLALATSFPSPSTTFLCRLLRASPFHFSAWSSLHLWSQQRRCWLPWSQHQLRQSKSVQIIAVSGILCKQAATPSTTTYGVISQDQAVSALALTAWAVPIWSGTQRRIS